MSDNSENPSTTGPCIANGKKRRGNPNWVKGVSGNPGGRPHEIKIIIEVMNKHTMDAFRTIYNIMQHGVSEMARLRAAEMILDRSKLGKPRQAVHHTGTIEHNLDGTAARDRLEGLLDRLAARADEGHPTAH